MGGNTPKGEEDVPMTFDEWWAAQVALGYIGPSRPIREFARRAWGAAIEHYGLDPRRPKTGESEKRPNKDRVDAEAPMAWDTKGFHSP